MPRNASGKDYSWSEDKAQLLLSIVHQYKVRKLQDNVDWESVKSKYEDIFDLFKNELPETEEEALALDKDYHLKNEITKTILTTKLKNIRLRFRKAVDTGRKSGQGRVIFLFFDLCEKIWGGSPATEQITSGVETSDLVIVEEDTLQDTDTEITVTQTGPSASGTSQQTPSIQSTSSNNPTVAIEQTSTIQATDTQPSPSVGPQTSTSVEPESGTVTANHRRTLLNDTLKNYRQNKLKRKVPVETQMVDMAKEELEIKRKMLDHMSQAEERHRSSMIQLTETVESVCKSIEGGFTVLKNCMSMMSQYPQPSQQYFYGLPHSQSLRPPMTSPPTATYHPPTPANTPGHPCPPHPAYIFNEEGAMPPDSD